MMQSHRGFTNQALSTSFIYGTCVRRSRSGPSYSGKHKSELMQRQSLLIHLLTDLRAMRPGAWIELQELNYVTQCDDGTMKDDYIVGKFLNLVKDGLAAFGVDLLEMRKNAQLLRDAGFVNVEERVFKIPVGTWPRNKTMKLIGMYMRSVIYDGLQGISMGPFTRGLKWTPQEVEVFLIGVRKGLMDSSTHSYIPFHVVYGQKPVAL